MKIARSARIVAAIFLAVVAISAAVPSLWTSKSYEEQFREDPEAKPSARFPLGTDALGRDRVARLLNGTRVSLALAPAAALLTCLAAALVGGVAGFAGGWTQSLVLGSVDLFLSLPWLFLLLLIRALLPLNTSPLVSVTVTFLMLGLLGWPASARVVNATVRGLRDSDFALQARASGCTSWKLFWRHFVPNLAPVLLAQFWIAVPVFILAEATLGMLGLGISEPLPSWGSLLRDLESADLRTQPWVAAPAALLAAVVGCLHLILPREDYSV